MTKSEIESALSEISRLKTKMRTGEVCCNYARDRIKTLESKIENSDHSSDAAAIVGLGIIALLFGIPML